MDETVKQEKKESTQEQSTQEQKTFTQSELNAVVNDRLKREREKYADYETLKEKAKKYDSYEEASKTELQKETDRADKLQKELDDMKQAEKVRTVREKISKETGIPANLLSGNTEEECKAQAEGIKAYASPSYPSLKDGGEPSGTPGGSTAQQFADWANQVF